MAYTFRCTYGQGYLIVKLVGDMGGGVPLTIFSRGNTTPTPYPGGSWGGGGLVGRGYTVWGSVLSRDSNNIADCMSRWFVEGLSDKRWIPKAVEFNIGDFEFHTNNY